MKNIKVLLVEDHIIVREGLRTMLDAEPDLEVVGEVSNGREAVSLAIQLKPDVVLMDIAMPLCNGIEATRQIRKSLPSAKVLVLSAHSDDSYVQSAMEAGACGFLLKQTSAHDACGAIRQVHGGGTFFTPSVAKRAAVRNQKSPDRRGTLKEGNRKLSARESEVLQLIAEGKPNKETASELGISIKTVEKHRENLMSKLNIHETAGLTRYAIETGIIESSVQLTIL
jgi:DNA-binding NarL/FixJ family response regulator